MHNELLNEYSSIVRHVVRSAYRSSSTIDDEDLYQVGELAVLRAARIYDPSYGTSLKSFITNLVRQDVYAEAARFLGIFTVDQRTTKLAAEASKLSDGGNSDEDIAALFNNSKSRNFDKQHIKDLRIAYSRRQYACMEEDSAITFDDLSLREICDLAVESDRERIIFEKRILGKCSVKNLAKELKLSPSRIYEIENYIRDRIRLFIEEGVDE